METNVPASKARPISPFHLAQAERLQNMFFFLPSFLPPKIRKPASSLLQVGGLGSLQMLDRKEEQDEPDREVEEAGNYTYNN